MVSCIIAACVALGLCACCLDSLSLAEVPAMHDCLDKVPSNIISQPTIIKPTTRKRSPSVEVRLAAIPADLGQGDARRLMEELVPSSGLCCRSCGDEQIPDDHA